MPSKKKVTKELKPTSGKAWRGEWEGLKALPSGKAVLLQKIRFRDLIAAGEIPNPLLPHVIQMMQGRKWEPSTEDELGLFLDLLDFVCIKTFKDPRIVENPEADDEISIRDVDFDDQYFVFEEMQSEIRFFRAPGPKRASDVAVVRGSEDLPEREAEPDRGADG